MKGTANLQGVVALPEAQALRRIINCAGPPKRRMKGQRDARKPRIGDPGKPAGRRLRGAGSPRRGLVR